MSYSFVHAHAENLDINALLALKLDKMEPGIPYFIGDRNAALNYPYLAVRKVDGLDGAPPTYEFGTVRDGSFFEKEEISKFRICAFDVKNRGAEYWERIDESDPSEESESSEYSSCED
jgi:hypothetical protein